MRREPFFVGDIVHVYNRGNRKQEIVRDDADRWYFLQMLFYFNDEYSDPNLRKNLPKSDFGKRLRRLDHWPKRDPLVDIIALTLMDNHYHLVLKEIKEGGVTKFMQKFGTGMTNRFNTRHDEVGRLFQGAYKARRVDKDTYLQYLTVYIHIKNVFELYPGGIENAVRNFDDAFEFAAQYPYSSLGGYFSDDHISSSVIKKEMMSDIIKDKEEFKEFAKNCLDMITFNDKKMEINS